MRHNFPVQIQFQELPRSLDREINTAIHDYSVGIFRYIEPNGETFRSLGSGTLIRRDGRFGILTAYHCLHACSPQVTLGKASNQRMVFVLRGGRQIVVGTDELFEHPLAPANPRRPSRGPDLTFIEILPGSRLERFRSVGSFCPLNLDPEAVLAEFAAPGTCTVCVGHPEVERRMRVEDGHRVFNEGKFHIFLGFLQGGVVRRGRWDFGEISANYAASATLPKTFEGVSGGGFWAVTFKKRKGVIEIDRIRFMGVAFYQSPIRHGKRIIRGHYARSVYDTAWRRVKIAQTTPEHPT